MTAWPTLPIAATWLFVGVVQAAQPSKAVTAVRFWNLSDATRVVVEVSSAFEFRSDRVPNPDRLFFDIDDCRMRLGSGMHTVPVGNELLQQIRLAQTQPGVTRIVFDLGADVEFSASRLINPDRLIVEFRRAEPQKSRLLSKSFPVRRTILRPVFVDSGPAIAPSATPIEFLARLQVAVLPPAPRSTKPVKARVKPRTTTTVVMTARPAKVGASASMTRVLGLKIGRIVLDPGHGGHDTGTIGPRGLQEKDLALDICKRIALLIRDRLGAEVVLTRSDDTFIPLERRTEIANEEKADLFISIHANASPRDTASGVETFYLNFTSDETAIDVATRENASSRKTVYELTDMLQQIALQDKIQESRQFAAAVQRSLYSASVKANSRTKNRGVKKAPFVVLIGASMPSILAEIGFVSNPRDEALLRRPDFRQKIAEGLYRGISQYAGTLSHFQVAKN
jgi:N-acetylmuramoyl-L-alanine amidase